MADMTQPDSNRYFAAQSSAHRIFKNRELPSLLEGWKMESMQLITSFAYWGTGGFSGPQLYPDQLYPVACGLDKILGLFPSLFSARLLISITKQ
jgi:hypothetical protein